MKDYQLIIFDWEGTLSDPVGVAVSHLATVADSLAYPTFNKRKARALLDLNFHEMIDILYNKRLASHEVLEFKAKFRQYHALHFGDEVLFYGAKALLKALSKAGKLIAIATSKSNHSLIRVLEEKGLRSFFFMTRSPEHCLSKPAPDMLLEIITAANVDKNVTVMIGDSPCDIEAAVHAGVDSIAINATGLGDEDSLKSLGASCSVKNYRQLRQLLLR